MKPINDYLILEEVTESTPTGTLYRPPADSLVKKYRVMSYHNLSKLVNPIITAKSTDVIEHFGQFVIKKENVIAVENVNE